MSSKIHQFEDSKEVGRAGEEIVREFLERRGYVLEWTGYGREKEANVLAPDFKVLGHVTRDGRKVLVGKTIEVKTDTQTSETGNVCLELLSNVATGRPGWVYSCPADFLGYLSINDRKLALVPMSAVRCIVEGASRRGVDRLFVGANPLFSGLGLLVKMSKLEKDSLYYGPV